LRVLCHGYSCVGTIQSDVNCRSEWFLRNNTFASGGWTAHHSAFTLVECQKACEFDPRCVAVSWRSITRECVINTDPNHTHTGSIYNTGWEHYDLVSRCNITPGQCFDSNLIANMNLLKTNLHPLTT